LIRAGVKRPSAERPQYLYCAYASGMTAEEISQKSGIDPWFTAQLSEIYSLESILKETTLDGVDYELMRSAKEFGFSDRQLADFWTCEPPVVKERR